MERESLLIKESIKGDEKAFADLVNNYKNYIFAIILNFIKDYGEAENVAQEVFFQIYTSLPNYNNENFKSWIGKIAANKSIDWIRKKKAKYSEEVIGSAVDLIDSKIPDNNPEAFILQEERKEKLIKIVKTMPEIYRVVIEKFYFHDKSYEVIAQEESVAIKTIASRLYRAKIILKEKWREENETL